MTDWGAVQIAEALKQIAASHAAIADAIREATKEKK